MLALIAIGLIGGLITGLSPCILPVLPAVFAVGATPNLEAQEQAFEGSGSVALAAPPRTRNLRPFAVVLGLVVSFSIFTLTGAAILTALNLPQDLLRSLGLVILVAVGVGMLVPKFGDLLERPFARLPKRQVNAQGGAFVLGLGLGLLFVPCAGPVLTAIAVVSASGTLGWDVVVLTLAFAVGVAIPLLAFALAGDQASKRVRVFREHAGRVRQVGGVILIATALLLALNVTDSLQRAVPGYTAALSKKIEGDPAVQEKLNAVRNPGAAGNGALGNCQDGDPNLASCGAAPEFTGISQWQNTTNNKPLSLAALKGKVVLIDFWTYSCINCQRTIPYLQAWDKAYRDKGLVIVGVHTPEFAFEKVPANVRDNAKRLGVTWPIALDNDFGTWGAYSNQFWPAHYLIDTTGTIRNVHFGEGKYDETEALIRELLPSGASGTSASAAISDTAPSGHSQTPESYLGYKRLRNVANTQIVPDQMAQYRFPDSLPNNLLAFSGSWEVGEERATAGSKAALALQFSGQKVFLVLGGKGSVTVNVDGARVQTVAVSGPPTLYELYDAKQPSSGLMTLAMTPGIEGYAFTFG